MPRGVRKTKKTRKPRAHTFLVLTSSCGKPEQAEFWKSAATVAAAQKLAEAIMQPGSDNGYEPPKSVYVVQILKIGNPPTGVVWS